MKPGAVQGYAIGIIGAIVLVTVILTAGRQRMIALGPANTGHQQLECVDCHEPAIGTTRQQLQANVRVLLNLRDEPVDFGHQDVDSDDCLACHDRPNDNHPIFRFNEPRFAEARRAIAPNSCISCHQEHRGVRVTLGPTYCKNCHEDLVLKNDPLDIDHQTLVSLQQWDSCLGCHDFHGNHVMEPPIAFEDALPLATIEAYFRGGPSPYSDQKLYQAQEER